MLMMFLLGVLAFAAWTFAMGLQASSIGLLKISAIYFGAGTLLAAFPLVALDFAMTGFGNPTGAAWVMLLAFVFVEELLKLLAARTQKTPANAFAIVTLFGVYELMLSKPSVMLLEGDWSLGLESATLFVIPALAFHGLTAGIYAFTGRDYPLGQLAVCIGLHTVYNAFADGLIFPMASDFLFLLFTITFVAITVFLWRRRTPQQGDGEVETRLTNVH